MVEKLKEGLKSKILLAVISIVLGVILIVRQKAAVDSLVRILGIVLLITAVVFLILFLAKKEKNPVHLIISIAALIIGLLFTIRPDMIVSIFPIIMGIILIISGLFDLWQVISAPKGTGAGNRVFLILFSILVILIGALCLFQPTFIVNFIVLFIGICLLFNGVFDLILMIMTAEKPAAKKE